MLLSKATVSRLVSAVPLATRSKFLKFLAYLYRNDDPDDAATGALSKVQDLVFSGVEYGAKRMHSVLLNYVQPNLGQPNFPAALAILNCHFPEECWGASLSHCSGSRINNTFEASLTYKPPIITNSQEGGPEVELTVSDFQSFVQERIDKHADRVASYGLAAARLVSSNIKDSMTDIWKSLPPGFGARNVDEETASEYSQRSDYTSHRGIGTGSDASNTSDPEEG